MEPVLSGSEFRSFYPSNIGRRIRRRAALVFCWQAWLSFFERFHLIFCRVTFFHGYPAFEISALFLSFDYLTLVHFRNCGIECGVLRGLFSAFMWFAGVVLPGLGRWDALLDFSFFLLPPGLFLLRPVGFEGCRRPSTHPHLRSIWYVSVGTDLRCFFALLEGRRFIFGRTGLFFCFFSVLLLLFFFLCCNSWSRAGGLRIRTPCRRRIYSLFLL